MSKERTENMLGVEEALGVPNVGCGFLSMEHYASVLQTCKKKRSLEHAHSAHMHFCDLGLDCSGSLKIHIIPTYVECGSIVDAQRVFIQLDQPNEYSWTSLLSGFIQCGLSEMALDLYQNMQEIAVDPSAQTFMWLLKACGRLKDLERGRHFHSEIAEKGFLKDVFVASTLVDMYVKCGALAEAQEVFDMLSVRVVVSRNALMSGYIEAGQNKEVIKCYAQMQREGASPDAVTFALVAKALGSIGAGEEGRELHKNIIRQGFGRHLIVGNASIDMYAKLGLLIEVREVFDKMPVQDVVSWTALISGYVDHGFDQEALACFSTLQSAGISPDCITYSCSLKACSSLKNIRKGQEIHRMIVTSGLQVDTALGNALIDMYAKCGSISEAHDVFDTLTTRNVVSWTEIIGGYADNGLGSKALDLFEDMLQEGFHPDAVTFTCAIKACGITEALEKGRALHKEAVREGFGKDLTVCNTLINMYAKCGSLKEAREVFDNLPIRDVVSWNALISGYLEQGADMKALKCSQEMRIEGTALNAVTYACILKACSSIGALDQGRELHKEVARKDFDKGLLVGNTLVDMYAKCGTVSEAQEAFGKLTCPDVVSWNALISAYAEQGPGEEAVSCFEQMQLAGVNPDTVTFACVIKACSNIGSIEKCQELHEQAREKGFERGLSVSNALISMYSKLGLLSVGRKVFDKLPVRDIVSWTALIAGYASHGSGEEALSCFQQMQLDGIVPDLSVLLCILKACGSTGALGMGQEMHADMTRKGVEAYSSIGESLITMYAQCGSLSEARETFNKLVVQDVVAWSSMIQGYCLNHESEEAIRVFEDMQMQGVKPDNITITCVLTACSHGSLVRKGQEYFKAIRHSFDLLPTAEHYTCIADLYGRSGLLYEAEAFIETFSPACEGAWAVLLCACKTQREAELGSRCLQQLTRMKSHIASWYVLVGDIYVGAGMLDSAYRLEELRKHAGVGKKIASAFIEVDKKVYEFVAGNNQSMKIAKTLASMNEQLKEEGHKSSVHQILKPISDAEKEASVCEHAEKLAIAFGLSNTPEGQTLRVTKNLKMCNDCHDASKIISRLERREIVLQDDCCMHHFKDGSCSCDGVKFCEPASI